MVRLLPLFAASAVLAAGPVFAQQPPSAAPAATTRCGGLLCDIYYANKPAPAPGQPEAPDPTRLPCRDFLCAAFGGRTPDPAPPAAEPVVAREPEMPGKAARRRHSAGRRKAGKAVAAAEPADAGK